MLGRRWWQRRKCNILPLPLFVLRWRKNVLLLPE
jgi:hypothetical protein